MTIIDHEYVAIVADDIGTDYLMIMIWGEPGDLICTLAVDDAHKRIVIKWPQNDDLPEHPSDYSKTMTLLQQGAETLKKTYPFLV